MLIFEAAALAAALTWAFTGIISAHPSKTLGALAFNRARMVMVFAMLALWVTIAGTWTAIPTSSYWPLIWSGVIGIFLGDTALFLTMNRLGPRRTAILFSLNAPISVVLGWLVLGEKLTASELLGIIITLSGVILAIVYGKRKEQLHQWENINGPLWIGILFGLAAALAQAIGAAIARPIMETGVDAVAASAIRVGASALCLAAIAALPINALRAKTRYTPNLLAMAALSGLLGMGIGMTLLLFALTGGEVGIVTTLSATTPAMMLPILWWRTKEMPALGAWVGAGLVIVGSALIFNG
ncbi:MAG: DMT family transporter [Pseudomonadota bacterium]